MQPIIEDIFDGPSPPHSPPPLLGTATGGTPAKSSFRMDFDVVVPSDFDVVAPSLSSNEQFIRCDTVPPKFANEEKQAIEDIHLEHGVVNGREYSRYTSGHQSLNIVRFKIGSQKFISINSNVLPFGTFGKLRRIAPLNTPNTSSERDFRNHGPQYDVLSVALIFDSFTITLHNCNVNLCIRAFSDI
jgi:hypothetical protein